ncbi:DUF4349 domain-containing protein [Schleiferia thermophila]|uniref:DUF4349 domain-containing protein n=1 Tax=Schleiferia thermophila TaxID=884107 RepID=UPI001267DCF8|nr:DUF4349 domain-containing protein [Schleiferia thermophila]
MRIRPIHYMVFIALLFFASCNSPTTNSNYTQKSIQEYADAANPISENQSSEEYSNRLLIKNGSIRFRTEDWTQSKETITHHLKTFGGSIVHENIDTYDYSVNVYLDCKVPSDNFDEFLNLLEKDLGKPESKSIRVEDVTKYYRDTEARIQNKKELEIRYRELLKQAKTIAEILEIESKLNEIRFEIEQYEQLLKNYDAQISYSQLSINLFQETKRDFQFVKRIFRSISNGWDNFLWFLIGLVELWPFLIAIVIFILFYKKKRSKSKD